MGGWPAPVSAAAPRLSSAINLLHENMADMLRIAEPCRGQRTHCSSRRAACCAWWAGGPEASRGGRQFLDAAIALVPSSTVGHTCEVTIPFAASCYAPGCHAKASWYPFRAYIRCFAIKSNFSQKTIGWNFLQLFSKPLDELSDQGTNLVFNEQEDGLVLDRRVHVRNRPTAGWSPLAHDFRTRPDRVRRVNSSCSQRRRRPYRSQFKL